MGSARWLWGKSVLAVMRAPADVLMQVYGLGGAHADTYIPFSALEQPHTCLVSGVSLRFSVFLLVCFPSLPAVLLQPWTARVVPQQCIS